MSLAQAGPPLIRFHDLRRTCATLLFSRNVYPKYVQDLAKSAEGFFLDVGRDVRVGVHREELFRHASANESVVRSGRMVGGANFRLARRNSRASFGTGLRGFKSWQRNLREPLHGCPGG